MKKIIVKYGLFSAAMSAALILLTGYFMNPESGHDKYAMYLGYGGMILAFTMIFLGMETYRKQNEGHITFGQCMKIGLSILLISAFVYALTWVIVYYTMVPNFLENYERVSLRDLKKTNPSPAILQKHKEGVQMMRNMYSSPFKIFAFTFLIEPLPPGIIITLISSLIMMLRNKKDRLKTA